MCEQELRKGLLILVSLVSLGATSFALAADEDTEDIVAKTSNGDEVILHPNGYWEYVDTKKAAVAKTKVEKIAREEGCPKGTRASFFGIGRCIPNDDPALKRGSLSGKGW
jgi:hypothetical protein